MGRAPRPEFRGALYHVYARGNRRDRIFRDEADYLAYLDDLRALSTEMGIDVIAFCLMPNHSHLCIQTNKAPLSTFMHRLNTRQSKRFNLKYGVNGHLHEGRYRAILVDERPYLLRLVRYIHQNPIRASLTHALAAWPYSSHREYLASDSWIARQRVLAIFADLKAFEEFMQRAPDEEDFVVFSSAGRNFKFVGSEAAVPELCESILNSTKRPELWMPLGGARPIDAKLVAEDAEQWLHSYAPEFRIEDLQSPMRHEPLRLARRNLVIHLRRKNHPVRSIAILLARDTASIGRLAARGFADRDRENRRT
jgi:putative transposase